MNPHSLPENVLQLDELEILVVVDNETDTLASVDAGVAQVPESFTSPRAPPSRHFEGHECKAVFDHFPGSPVDIVLGVYHLAGKAMEARIEATVRDLQARIEPRLVAPGHCTGWRAKASLAAAFAAGRYAPSVVGTLYRLSATG